jgi:hypothetical protein
MLRVRAGITSRLRILSELPIVRPKPGMLETRFERRDLLPQASGERAIGRSHSHAYFA